MKNIRLNKNQSRPELDKSFEMECRFRGKLARFRAVVLSQLA